MGVRQWLLTDAAEASAASAAQWRAFASAEGSGLSKTAHLNAVCEAGINYGATCRRTRPEKIFSCTRDASDLQAL